MSKGKSMLSADAYSPNSANTFTRSNLELTFQLLRKSHPCLALLIQNGLAELRQSSQPCDCDQQLALQLAPETVRHITETLAKIAQLHSQQSYSNEELIAIRCVLMDWLIYAQSLPNLGTEKSPAAPTEH